MVWGEPHGYGSLNEAGRVLLLFHSSMGLQYLTPGFRSVICVNRHSNILSQSSGNVLIMKTRTHLNREVLEENMVSDKVAA